MGYYFDENHKKKVIDHFGEKFYLKVVEDLNPYLDKLKIVDVGLIQSFSANLIFKGQSKKFGPVVIKIGRSVDEFLSEVAALRHFAGKPVCQLLDVDEAHLILIQAYIEPGITLREEKSLEKRLDIFCEIYNQLHPQLDHNLNETSPVIPKHKFKSYKDWVFRITDYMEQQEDWQDITQHMKRSKALFIDLSKTYSLESLLHGDFHYYNMLKGNDGYKIIDPKGVKGDPLFDLPRYMLNEFWDEEDDLVVDATMDKVFAIIHQRLGVPIEVLKQALYIEGTMANCWNIEDGASLEMKEEMLETIEWLETYTMA